MGTYYEWSSGCDETVLLLSHTELESQGSQVTYCLVMDDVRSLQVQHLNFSTTYIYITPLVLAILPSSGG